MSPSATSNHPNLSSTSTCLATRTTTRTSKQRNICSIFSLIQLYVSIPLSSLIFVGGTSFSLLDVAYQGGYHPLPLHKTNNPADLRNESNPIGSVMSSIAQLGDKGPHILSDEQKKGVEEPLSRDELRRRAAELNK
ncbi:17343_t:CDS:2 [Acaulospora colombiana]|uniref:17343_t:CDS:1 n=1 Tax=Acaulospora colombiana TaxID=27376 RepID=A0ACA9NGV0_9GLOM|nr:17343_t:CDS:2 [Acaulospora colombiana]